MHAYTIELAGKPLRFRAVCQCGDFTGPWRDARYEARGDHEVHLDAAPPPPPRPGRRKGQVAHAFGCGLDVAQQAKRSGQG